MSTVTGSEGQDRDTFGALYPASYLEAGLHGVLRSLLVTKYSPPSRTTGVVPSVHLGEAEGDFPRVAKPV